MVAKTRIVLMGTPNFAVNPFRALLEAGYNVVGIVSQPDRKVGRKQEIVFTPTKELALEFNIPIYQVESIKNDYHFIIDLKPDLIITCAYGQFIPKAVLELPKLGAINIHASLLPKYRGGAPIHHAILNGEPKTGISIMKMELKMDAGDVYTQHELNILENDNYDTLAPKLSNLAKEAIINDLPKIISNEIKAHKQDESKVSFGYNIKSEEEKINWNQTAKQIDNHVRGLSSIPGAHTIIEGTVLKVYEGMITLNKSSKSPGTIVNLDKGILVATSTFDYLITNLQLAGKKRMAATDLINGMRNRLTNAHFE